MSESVFIQIVAEYSPETHITTLFALDDVGDVWVKEDQYTPWKKVDPKRSEEIYECR